MVDFRLSPEAESLRTDVIAWLGPLDAATLAAHADGRDLTGLEEGFERQLQAQAGARGWLDLPLEQQAVFNFEVARADAPVIDTAMTLTGAALRAGATNEHHRAVLADMVAGRVEACSAYTEPGAGSDLGAMAATARRHDDGWVLDGTKTLLTGPHKSDWCVTLARTAPDAPPRSAFSMFLVPMATAGVTVVAQPTLNGWELGEVHFEAVAVGADALLGVEGEGWRQMGAALAAERSGTFWLGFARHSLDLLLAHVATADREGAPLADDALVLDQVGRLEAAWASADLLSRRALCSQMEGVDVGAATAMAKVVATELLLDIAQTATEIAGADGLVWAPLFSGAELEGAAAGRLAWEYLERIHGTIGGGANEVHRDAIAAALLGRPTP